MSTFTEWVCPTCGCMWVYRNTIEGQHALALVRAEHHCVGVTS